MTGRKKFGLAFVIIASLLAVLFAIGGEWETALGIGAITLLVAISAFRPKGRAGVSLMIVAVLAFGALVAACGDTPQPAEIVPQQYHCVAAVSTFGVGTVYALTGEAAVGPVGWGLLAASLIAASDACRDSFHLHVPCKTYQLAGPAYYGIWTFEGPCSFSGGGLGGGGGGSW